MPQITAANFQRQQAQTTITVSEGVPLATGRIDSFASNKEHAEATRAQVYECVVWQLASILFDNYYDDISSSIPGSELPHFEQRIRKDRLSAFWAAVCEDEANTAVAAASTAEERALAHLSAHRVPQACNALLEGQDFRLATLLAQIGGSRTLHEDMEGQIENWRKLNVLSEMSDAIRTLYELLAGNTCTSIGKRGPVEDRAATFLIPERFGLDWKRAFGLKLWYAINEDAPLEEAVCAYAKDLAFKELKRPLPFFLADSGIALLWKDPAPQTREDVLWGLLRLFAERSSAEHADGAALAGVLRPENAVGLPLSFRLTFELYRALAPHLPHHASAASLDAIAVSFATELEAVDQWLWALFAVLHLSEPQQRRAAIQGLLARHARALSEHDAQLWATLTGAFHLPAAWLWEAKALYVRATKGADPALELEYLIRSRNVDEAHRALVEARQAHDQNRAERVVRDHLGSTLALLLSDVGER